MYFAVAVATAFAFSPPRVQLGLAHRAALQQPTVPPRCPPPPLLAKKKQQKRLRKKSAPGRRAKAGGSSFSGADGSSLECKLREQHLENCAKAKQTFAVCDSAAASSYAGGWTAHAVPKDAIAPGNAPFATERLLLQSSEPLLSSDDCASLIEQMEAHGAAHGWDARYPIAGFTREVNVAEIPEAVALLNRALSSCLLPEVSAEFGVDAASLRVNEALVVKYDAASGHNCLPVHQDFSLVTVNIALSEATAYEGGGTWFQHSGATLVPARGEAVLHAGGIPHCGVPVSSGSRYQLVLFLLSVDQPELSGRLQAIGAAAGAKRQGALQDVELSTNVLERALLLNERDAESWSQLAHNAAHREDAKGAEACFEKVVALSGGRDFAALTSLAALQREASRPLEALTNLRRALEAGPPPSPTQAAERLRAQHEAGMAMLDLGRHEEAGLAFEAVVTEQPEASESWSALGVCMAELGQPEAALACQRQVLSIRTRKAEASA